MVESAADKELVEAAELAFAMLRFEFGAAHRHFSPDAGGPHEGKRSGVLFLPVSRPVPYDLVVPYLASCPGPAMLAPPTTAGMVSLMLLSELQGDRRRWAEDTLARYRTNVLAQGRELALTPESPIVLEFDDEAHVFSFATLCRTFERFVVVVAGSLVAMRYEDPRARARLMLYRSDGASTWGAACPVRPREGD
ncbi:MAG TPA: hypothetical protein VLE53_17500 [Gemmatimonadaceae bacterium]|nr:hypothetical protein [Gemmatimonadaceae bacterium]